MKISGGDKHLARLKRLSGAAMTKEAGKAIYASADMHAVDAALSITAGAVSGKNHVASKPGEAPNADTHQLDRSIHAEKTGPLTAHSVADAPYAVALEKGTSKVAERPYMRPAAKRIRPKAEKLVVEAVKRVVRGGTL